MTLHDRVDRRGDRVVVPYVAGVELVGQSLDRAAGARHHGRALIGEDRADSGADSTDSAGHQNDPVLEAQAYF